MLDRAAMRGAQDGGGWKSVESFAIPPTLRAPMMRSLVLLCALLSHALASDLVVEGWHHRVWSVYPIEKIKADEDVPVTPKSDAVTISAARDEHEPFLLLLRPERSPARGACGGERFEAQRWAA